VCFETYGENVGRAVADRRRVAHRHRWLGIGKGRERSTSPELKGIPGEWRLFAVAERAASAAR
jgi:hypothetical protein